MHHFRNEQRRLNAKSSHPCNFLILQILTSGTDVAYVLGTMSSIVNTERRRWDDEITNEITQRTHAAKKIIDAAETMGILGRLMELLSRRCGIIFGSKANSPCQTERRKHKWHGQEDPKKGTEFLDRIDMEADGESAQYDQMAESIIKRLEQKPKPKKR